MIRMCYSKFHVGDRKFGEKEPLDKKGETSGLCPDCQPKEWRRLEKDIETMMAKKKAKLAWIKWAGGIETRDDGYTIYHNIGFVILCGPGIDVPTKCRSAEEAKRMINQESLKERRIFKE